MKSFQIKYILLFGILFTIAFTNDIKQRNKTVGESLNKLNNTNFSKFEKTEVKNYDKILKNDVDNEENDENENTYDDDKDDDDDDDDNGDDNDNDVNNENDSKEIVDSLSLFELKKHLLGLYDRNSRPIFNSSKPLMVRLGVSVAQINNLDVNFQVYILIFYNKY